VTDPYRAMRYHAPMTDSATSKKSIDMLAAIGAMLGAVSCVAILAFGDLDPEWSGRVEGWAEALGAFVMAAFGRHKWEAGKDA